MLDGFKSWLTGVSSKVWAFIFPILKSVTLQAIADVQETVIAAILAANSQSGLSSKEKFEYAKNKITADLKVQSKTLSESAINLAIELCVAKIKDQAATDTTTK